MGRTSNSKRKTKAVKTLSTAELQHELMLRRRAGMKLATKRRQLMQKLSDIDAKLGELGIPLSVGKATEKLGGKTRGKRGYGRNPEPLYDALYKTMGSKTMGVTQVTEAVQKNGYQTKAVNFRVIVNQCLINHPDMFEKVARGQYKTKPRLAASGRRQRAA